MRPAKEWRGNRKASSPSVRSLTPLCYSTEFGSQQTCLSTGSDEGVKREQVIELQDFCWIRDQDILPALSASRIINEQRKLEVMIPRAAMSARLRRPKSPKRCSNFSL